MRGVSTKFSRKTQLTILEISNFGLADIKTMGKLIATSFAINSVFKEMPSPCYVAVNYQNMKEKDFYSQKTESSERRWIGAVGSKSFRPSKYSFHCLEHFDRNDMLQLIDVVLHY